MVNTSSFLITVHVCLTPFLVEASKILLYPWTTGTNSRVLAFEKMAIILRDHGHEVYILANRYCKPHMNLERVGLFQYDIDPDLLQSIDFDHSLSFMDKSPWQIIYSLRTVSYRYTEYLLKSRILEKVKRYNFGLLIYDWVAYPCTTVAEYLDIPTIIYSNYGLDNTWHFFHNPTFYSFVPSTLSPYAATMGFWDRLQNAYLSYQTDEIFKHIHIPDTALRNKYIKTPLKYPLVDAFKRASIIFSANTHFAYDWPRPVMPHIVPIVGLTTFPIKPLPQDFMDFVESAAHGVIVMSFGTQLPRFDSQRASVFAQAFSQLPQRVIWRYTGTPPENIGNNTLVSQWIPQLDLLRHPKVILFVTHCGVSGSFEAMFTATPVIAVPIFWDQRQHATRLTKRLKMGLQIDFRHLEETSLKETIKNVLAESVFQENANRIAAILADQPMNVNDTLTYWVEYVIRHKGPMHFHSQDAYNLTWYQFYMVDIVLLFVVSVVMSVSLILLMCCRLLKPLFLKRTSKYSVNKKTK